MEKTFKKILTEKIQSIIDWKEKRVEFSFAWDIIVIEIDKWLLQAKIGNTSHRIWKDNIKWEYNIGLLIDMINSAITLSSQTIETATNQPGKKNTLREDCYQLNSGKTDEILLRHKNEVFIFNKKWVFVKKETFKK